MRLYLNFESLVGLVKLDLGDNYTQFESVYLKKIDELYPFWKPTKRDPKKIFDTFKSLLESEPFHVSNHVTNLIKSLTIPVYSPSINTSSRSASTSDSSCPSSDSPTGVIRRNRNKRSVVTKPKPPSSVSPNPTGEVISRTASKKLRVALKSEHSFNCSVKGCQKCTVIRTTAPVTKCTHPNPHPSGWFVHINRKVSRTFHQDSSADLLKGLSGLPNPLLKETVGMINARSNELGCVADVPSIHDSSMSVPMQIGDTQSSSSSTLRTSNSSVIYPTIRPSESTMAKLQSEPWLVPVMVEGRECHLDRGSVRRGYEKANSYRSRSSSGSSRGFGKARRADPFK